ncbi:tryptophan synthase subunit alpha [Treponema parvum]|uniref:tryptophan synthase n=1 Tax=Treponema parvum TaxID=138851 RepID=A0A975F252_9SPIR|nr:tryptophan synthase subunit alpha [Treponema parvum]QTQ12983.1 tryptophan synthase subunit alpha [Treponema parvum]
MGIKTICFLSFGYPTINKAIDIAGLYVKGGCDAIEVAIPPKNGYRDSSFIQQLYKEALDQTSNYDDYLEGIDRMIKKYTSIEFFLILYHEVISAIGAAKIGAFCKEHNINYIISGDLHDFDAIKTFKLYGVKLSRSVNYKMEETDIHRCIETDGFTYMQAFPSIGQYIKPGFEKLKTCIKYLRERGVSEPIFCGAGIKNPDDVKEIKRAGGDGFFVGSSIIKLYDKPEELVALIREYKNAAQN